MDSEKIVREWDFLNEFERVFGQKAPYFMAYSVFESAEPAKIPEYIGLKKELEEANRRAETFERMAFEAAAERDLAAEIIRNIMFSRFCECDVCAYGKKHEKCAGADLFCDECKDPEGCPCGSCGAFNRNFVFSAAMAKKLIEDGEYIGDEEVIG